MFLKQLEKPNFTRHYLIERFWENVIEAKKKEGEELEGDVCSVQIDMSEQKMLETTKCVVLKFRMTPNFVSIFKAKFQ